MTNAKSNYWYVKMDLQTGGEKLCYTFALKQHIKIAYSKSIEMMRMKDVFSQVEEKLKERYKNLRKQLQDSRGYTFQKVLLVDRGETQDTKVADASASSTIQSDPKYAADIYQKDFSPPDNQWTEDLLKQRLKVLNEVVWCAMCDQICKVKVGEEWNVYGEKHLSRYTRGSKYHPLCNNAMPTPILVRDNKRKIEKEKGTLEREMQLEKKREMKRKRSLLLAKRRQFVPKRRT